MINKLIFLTFYMFSAATEDARIKVFDFNEGNIYNIDLVSNFKTKIILDTEEQIKKIVFGNGHGIDLYREVSKNEIHLNPLYVGINTNLIIETTLREYMFSVQSIENPGKRDEQVTYVVRFKYIK